jgi:hypothetical protein
MEEVRMTKTLLVLATASTLTLSYALAQSPSPPSPSTPSAQSSSGTSGAASDKATNAQSSTSSTSASASPGAITAQTPDQWLATKFKGTQVIGTDDTKIGSVDDILFDRTGSIKAVIVGVGGFLGIGSKQVAMPLPSLQVVSGKDGAPDQLRLSMTKDQLASAPEFKPYEPPRPTASAPSRPATSGTSPMSPPPARSQ